jgi:hypothetical protein
LAAKVIEGFKQYGFSSATARPKRGWNSEVDNSKQKQINTF